MSASLFQDIVSPTRCISMYPPWSNWVGLGWKTIESRTHQRFKSLVGQRIAIHSAVRWDEYWLEIAGKHLSEAQIARTHDFLRIYCMQKGKVSGAVICTALVQDHRRLITVRRFDRNP
jgi:hypothetical protein